MIPGTCESYHFGGFIERVKRATFRGESQQRYLGILAAIDFDKQVWTDARQQALWTINLRQTFGDAALDILAQFEILLRAVDPTSALDPDTDIDSMANLLSELKTNPIVTDLRCIAFETLTALVMRAIGYEDVAMGTNAPFQKSTRDVDVHGHQGDVAAITECKAILAANDLTGNDVTKFFTETVPAFAKWYRPKYGDFKKLEAQLWTTGRIGKEAQDAFESLTLGGRVSPSIKDHDAVLEAIPSQLKKRLQKLLTVIAMPINDA